MVMNVESSTDWVRDKREQDRDVVLPKLGNVGVARSPQWKALREKFIALNNRCKACGNRDDLEVHHILPFHLYPEKELDFSNLMTLCCDGRLGNCHLLWGHCGRWREYSPRVEHFTEQAMKMLFYAREDRQ